MSRTAAGGSLCSTRLDQRRDGNSFDIKREEQQPLSSVLVVVLILLLENWGVEGRGCGEDFQGDHNHERPRTGTAMGRSEGTGGSL